jgi:hypothetical protein
MLKQDFFDEILIIQSYPSLMSTYELLKNSNTQKLLIIIGDKSLEKFFKIALDTSKVKIVRFGNYSYLSSKLRKFFFPLHLIYLRLSVKSYRCNKLYITFKDWADISSIQIPKIVSKKKICINPFEASQFQIKDRHPSSFYDFIYLFFHKIFMNNILVLKKTKPKLNRKCLVGLSHKYLTEKDYKIINKTSIPDTNVLNDFPIEKIKVNKKGILFIEKDLFSLNLVSKKDYWLFIKELVNSYKSNGLCVYLKFKPRNFDISLAKKYSEYGMEVLPSFIPLQLYFKDPSILLAIGFTSSGMAYQNDFHIISFVNAIKTNKSAKTIIDKSVKNTIIRAGDKKIYFPMSVEELVKLSKDIIKNA